MNYLDLITALLGLAYILLEYRASAWMWAVGAVMQLLGIVLYYQKGLYADCGMEFYYLAMTAYGCWRWTRRPAPAMASVSDAVSAPDGSPADAPPLSGTPSSSGITHIPFRLALIWTCVAAMLWALIWWLLSTFTDSTVPVADAFTTALSLVGIWALAHKYLEQWAIWIIVDVVTCWLYFQKEIPFKASLYALYVVVAIAGYRRWRRLMAADVNPS